MRTIVIIAMAALLGGCAFGRTYSYNATSINVPAPAGAGSSLVVAVHDRRPYVVSGGKPERFVGIMRGGYGNPFDVNTASGGPMATEMRDALVKALRAKGYTVEEVALAPADLSSTVRRKLTEARGKKFALVTLNEWKSDTLFNSDLHFDVTLAILNDKAEQLATSSTKGKDSLGKAGAPGITAGFARKIEALFDDDKVAAALRS